MSADGKIKIAIEVDGKQISTASKELTGLESSGQKAGSGAKKAEDGVKKVGEESTKAGNKVKKFVAALGLISVGVAAVKALRSAMDTAIKRFDTLNKYPKVLRALGVDAEESERSIQRLSDGIEGLPTLLNDIASTAQRMYTSFNDIDKATDTAIALNNALLGSGASAADAQRGTEQYMQVLQKGKFEMDEWRTLQETMDVGLVKIAESFGFAGASAKQDLYKALQDGKITMKEFNDRLIEIGTSTGVMAELAKENSLGMATSISNLKVAASRGLADILKAVNELSKEVTGKEISQHIDGLKKIVNAAFKAIATAIQSTAPFLKAFINGLKAVLPVVKALTPAIAGLVAAYATYAIIDKARTAIEKSNAVLKTAQASTQALTLLTKAKTAAQIAETSATKAETVAEAAKTGAVSLSTLAIGVMTGTISASTAVKVVATAVTYAFSAAIKALLGPIGLIIAIIGVLVAGITALIKWMKKENEETKRLNEATEALSETTNELTESVENNASAYEKSQQDIKSSAQANEDLARKIEELSRIEHKSASEKALLKSYIDELNGSVEGLNLSYVEEADSLNMSAEQMKARIALMKEQETAQEAQQRLTEILKEQATVEAQLAETNALREEWNQKLEDGEVKGRHYKKAIKELDEQEQALKDTLHALGEQQVETETQLKTSLEAITDATERNIGRQIKSYEELEEAHQQIVDGMATTWDSYEKAATEMFEALSDEVEITVEEMTENLEENQRIIGEWAENIAELADRGVDEGLLDTLREAGPESAGHVNALVNASDEELEKLSDVFAKGGDVATQALAKSLGIEESGVMDAIGHLVIDAEKSLKEQIEKSNFEKLGSDIAAGVAGGIDQNKLAAERAAKEMARYVEQASKDQLGIRSPSTAFIAQGRFITEGLSLGIMQGTTSVIKAIKDVLDTLKINASSSVTGVKSALDKLVEITRVAMDNILARLKSGTKDQENLMKHHPDKLTSPFGGLSAKLRNIGASAMDGLISGMKSKEASVTNTAKKIAGAVQTSMQTRLQIKSPSRIMRDQVGRWIPEGLAEGINKSANVVHKALDSLIVSPELALGTSVMRANVTADRIAQTTYNQRISHDNGVSIHIDKIENYSDSDIPQIMQESAFILSREGRRLDG